MAICLNGQVVDLGTAHEYYVKFWNAILPRVEKKVIRLGNYRFRLVGTFSQAFRDDLRTVTRSAYLGGVFAPNAVDLSQMTYADLAAIALCRAGWGFGRTPADLEKSPGPPGLWPLTATQSEIKEVRRREELREERIGCYVCRGHGDKLRPYEAGKDSEDERIIFMLVASGPPPEIDIHISGQPIRNVLHDMCGVAGYEEQEQVHHTAQKIWEFLMKEAAVWVGVEQERGGRPREERIAEAAFLKYFQYLTWSEVARKLCEEKHEHTLHCATRLRRGVGGFFKQIEQAALGLPPVAA
jgi:hypothetical protein